MRTDIIKQQRKFRKELPIHSPHSDFMQVILEAAGEAIVPRPFVFLEDGCLVIGPIKPKTTSEILPKLVGQDGVVSILREHQAFSHARPVCLCQSDTNK